MKIRILLVLAFITLAIAACKKSTVEPKEIKGCMDPNSLNYNSSATVNDGSCQYAKSYIPLKSGVFLQLRDTVSLSIPPLSFNVGIRATFEIFGDTSIGGKNYKKFIEYFGYELIGTSPEQLLSTSEYYVRQNSNGQYYRVNMDSTSEQLWLDYPLDPGRTWYDATDSITYAVESIGVLTVPSGSYSDVVKLKSTDNTGQSVYTYLAKDVGNIRTDLTYDYNGFPLNISVEADSVFIP